MIHTYALSERGELGRAIDETRAGLARFPDEPVLLYNLACYESLDGRHDEALTDLRRALELDAGMREMARVDEDFAPLRDRPAFEQLLTTRGGAHYPPQG